MEVPAISKHLKNIYDTNELEQNSVVSILETVQKEVGRNVKRSEDYYRLEAVLVVGYRVNFTQAIQFLKEEVIFET